MFKINISENLLSSYISFLLVLFGIYNTMCYHYLDLHNN
jgi:hypothetical protein